MPITPRFRLDQTCKHLKITIHLPHTRVNASSMELLVDGNSIHFHVSPYLLVLPNLPGDLVDDESIGKEAAAKFDPIRENGILEISIYKAEEILWEDLDMIGRFLMTPAASNNNNSTTNADNDNTNGIMDKDPERKIKVLSSSIHQTSLSDNPDNNDTNKNTVNDEEDVVEKRIECNQKINGNSGRSSDLLDSSLLFSTDDNDNGDNNVGGEEEDGVGVSVERPMYGFLNQFDSVFTSFAREGLAPCMLEIPFPDGTPMQDRRRLRLEMELSKFDADRYCNDTFYLSPEDDEVYMPIIKTPQCFYYANQKEEVSLLEQETDMDSPSSSSSFFTKEESQYLASISSSVRVSNLTKSETDSSLLHLMDLLYAFAYNYRMTDGEPTCESSWTISILSPTLSWLESYNSEDDSIATVVGGCVKRALTYPYFRSFDFCTDVVIQDVIQILRGGRRMVLRCLLRMHDIMDGSEFHYLNNKLTIDPFLLWIQHLSSNDDSMLQTFAHQILQTSEKRDDGTYNRRKFKEELGIQFLLPIEQQFLEKTNYSDDSSASSEQQCTLIYDSSASSEESDSDDDEISSCGNTKQQCTLTISNDSTKSQSTTIIGSSDCGGDNNDDDDDEEEYEAMREKLNLLYMVDPPKQDENEITTAKKESEPTQPPKNDVSLLEVEATMDEQPKRKLIEEIIR